MKNILTLILLLFIAVSLNAQDLLNYPQKIIIDSARNRYLVSNYGSSGDLVAIDYEGNQSYFIENAGLVDGMVIVGDTVYGSALNGKIKAFNLNTGDLVMTLNLYVDEGVEFLSGLVADSAGIIYTSERWGDRIFKINPKTRDYWIYAQGDPLFYPNGMLYEQDNNRIIVCLDQANPKILAINLTDSTISILAQPSIGGSDGIERDKDDNYYVTGYELQGMYKFDSEFNMESELFYKKDWMIYPTYNEKNNSLLVTLYKQHDWREIFIDAIRVTDIIITGEGGATSVDTYGGTLQMYADVLPIDASDTSVIWSRINGTAKGTISETGLLTIYPSLSEENGTLLVKATADDGSGVTQTIEITVTNQTTGIPEYSEKNFLIYPNPFTDQTNIQFNLTKNVLVNVVVFDNQGKKIKTLINQTMQSGIHNIYWDGRDSMKNKVSDGTYFIRIFTDNTIETQKIITLKR